MADTNANEAELPSETVDALDATPLDTAGGGQFQKDWAASPEGQDYLAKSDEREAAYVVEEKIVGDSIASQQVEPVNEAFEQAPEEEVGDQTVVEFAPSPEEGTDSVATTDKGYKK